MELRKPQRAMQWLKMFLCYRQAFPREERKPFGIIVKMYRQGKSDIWCWTENGAFAGFAATINGENLVLLDYFAVAKKFRKQGIGTKALRSLQSIYSNRGLFVEIERICPEAENLTQREKRKQFYRNCAMEELGVQATVFGVEMDLLGSRCSLSYEGYRDFYRDHYGVWAAEHITPIPHKEDSYGNQSEKRNHSL